MSLATDSKAISSKYDSDLEEDEYEVEKILKHRVLRHGRERMTEYYIKWKGFDDHWNSWEPENVVEADDLVEVYWQSKSKKRGLPDPTVRKPSGDSQLASVEKSIKTPKSSKRSLDTRKVDVRPFTANSEDDLFETPIPYLNTSPNVRAPSPEQWGSDSETEQVVFDLDFRTELSWDWELSIASVEAVTHKGPVLYGVVRWNDGTLAMYPTGLIRRRCAQKLIDFYEKKLEFPEADAGLLISN